MAAAYAPAFITVRQYDDLPVREDVFTELDAGQVVELTRPKMKHARLQSRLVRLLRPLAEHMGVVEMEVAFRPIAEFELRGADVAFVSKERWESTDDDDNLYGSPELVIEVLSPSNTKPSNTKPSNTKPSNTKKEMRDKAILCLATGATEFWMVDPVGKNVAVVRREAVDIYEIGQEIPLPLFSTTLAVSEIFA